MIKSMNTSFIFMPLLSIQRYLFQTRNSCSLAVDCVSPVGGVSPSGSCSHLPLYSEQLEAQRHLTPGDDPPSDNWKPQQPYHEGGYLILYTQNGCKSYLPVSWFSAWIWRKKNILVAQRLNCNAVYIRAREKKCFGHAKTGWSY